MRQNIPVASELKPAELRAWRAFLDAQATLLRRLEAELVGAEGMTLAEFDVLAQLGLASDGRLRMTELSERVRLSRSGNCATDRRGTWAILTPAGNARLRRAQPLHLRGVRQHFARRLSPAQLDELAGALEPLAADIRPGDGATAR